MPNRLPPVVITEPKRPSGCPSSADLDSRIAAYNAAVVTNPGATGIIGQFAQQLSGSGAADAATIQRLFTALSSVNAKCFSASQLAAWKSGSSTDQSNAAAQENAYHVGILGFLSTLTNPATYVRGAELVVGVILLIIGMGQLAKLYNVSVPVPSALKGFVT